MGVTVTCHSPLLPLTFMSSAPVHPSILPDLDPRLDTSTQAYVFDDNGVHEIQDYRSYQYFANLVLCSGSPEKILDVHLSFPPGGPRPSSTSHMDYRVMLEHEDKVLAELWDYQPGVFHPRPADGQGLVVKEVEDSGSVSNAVSYSVNLC